jgi:hypothetical protein
VLALFSQVKGSPRSLQADGTRNVIAAMKQQGISRLIKGRCERRHPHQP